VKSVEDLQVQYDGTVRNAQGMILQFLYGEDGMDGAKVEEEHLDKWSDEKFVWKNVDTEIKQRELEQMKRDQEVLKSTGKGAGVLPVPLRRLILQARKRFRAETIQDIDYIVNSVYGLLERLTVSRDKEMETNGTLFLKIHVRMQLSSKMVIENYKMSKQAFDYVIGAIEQRFENAKATPGEMVGVLCAQSLGAPLTQLTLNSVEYNETLIIRWKGTPLKFSSNDKVGKFIDGLVEQFPEKIQLQPDGHTIYLPLEPGTAEALSTDEDGNMVWTELEAVTRHPPINKDGSSTLVKITTDSGRTAIATKAKSFLVGELQEDGTSYKIKEKEGSELNIGDNIPIVKFLYPKENNKTFDVKTVLNPRENLFTDYVIEGNDIMPPPSKSVRWFHKIKDKVPYNRSDTFRVALKNLEEQNMFIPGRVYPKNWLGPSGISSWIPSEIELTKSFGFFVGAYLAEGCTTRFQVCIANNDSEYRKKAVEWSEQFGITNRLNGRVDERGESTTICIHSTILRNLIVKICGKGSYEKRVPDFAYSAPDEFVIGLLDAYLCGDGSFETNGRLTAYSRSIKLRDGISLLMTRFDIHTRLFESMIVDKRDQQDPEGTSKPLYHLTTSAHEAEKMLDIVTTLKYKNDRLKREGIVLQHKDKRQIRIQNDVMMDKIVKIEDFTSDHPFVYDLTVEDTRNMTLLNGILEHDTFHAAGSAAKNVTSGVPRFTELIDVSKHMKTPSVSISLDDTLKPAEVMAKMEHTTLRKVIHKFVREPLPELFKFTVSSENELPTYRCIELNSELCIAKGITMQEIANHMKDKVSVLHTSENSERWLMWFPKGSSVPLDMHLKGVENIDKIVMRQSIETDEWIMDTDGSNLIEVLSHPGVDWVKTTCNNIVETAEIMGIEAARNLLLREIRNVISVDGNYVNYRHIAILVDAMSYRGNLTPMSRHGLNMVSDTSVFHRASFEKTVNELSNAGIYSERDPLKSITASILMGKLSETGTGFVDIVEDEKEFKFETGNDSDDSDVSGFEVDDEPEISNDLKGFEVPDYDDLYSDEETETVPVKNYIYVPSSPKVAFQTKNVNYVPSSPKVVFKRISTYIPSSP